MKKKIIIAALISLGLMLIIVIGIIPWAEIDRLEKEYVKVTQVKGKVVYTLVKERPPKWVTLGKINSRAVAAIVISEDWAFYHHNGYDLNQVVEALEDRLNGKRLRGASTISQQVVKNLYLSPDKSLWRKLKELGMAVYLEKRVSKKKILETYLNVIEYGDKLYGIGPAAKHYFKKRPAKLNVREGAFLAMLLPSPKKHAQSYRKKKTTPYAQKTIDSILNKMHQAKLLKAQELAQEKSALFPWERAVGGPAGVGSLQVLGAAIAPQTSPSKTAQPSLSAVSGKRVKTGKKLDLDGSKIEASYKVDKSMQISDDPVFDKDALIEDQSGLEEEFSLE